MINSKFGLASVLLVSVFSFLITSCSSDSKSSENRVESSIIPESWGDRPITVTESPISLSSKNVVFNVWDSGQIDGDIITLVVNGRIVLDTYELTGSEFSVPVELDNLGYNYVLLYAHNEGSISPNTAALSMTDSDGNYQLLTLSADLLSNSACDLIVQ